MGRVSEKTFVWAHRGACGYSPENTLEAFKLAVDMKADGVELDVHFTKDRRVVVIHDEKIDRTSNGQGPVTSYTLDELKFFDFGYKFYGEKRGIKIPTLDEVYELLAPTGLIVNVEIKSKDAEIASACDAIAKKYGMENKVLYSSFDHLQLKRMKEVAPEALTAPLYGFNLLDPWKYACNMGAYAVHPSLSLIPNLENYIENCHNAGIRIHPWTINEEEKIEWCIDNGCDAIITNYPDRAIAVRDKK
ncbi:MAG: glycerophosphodiester phosphodiesterase [Ruminococcaceae bacterium]|nr:glycerophosphodiester phosphodiesterase [Oscillospiraceae bacterium]